MRACEVRNVQMCSYSVKNPYLWESNQCFIITDTTAAVGVMLEVVVVVVRKSDWYKELCFLTINLGKFHQVISLKAWMFDRFHSPVHCSMLGNDSVNRLQRQLIRKQQSKCCCAITMDTVFSVLSAPRRPAQARWDRIDDVLRWLSKMTEKRWQESNLKTPWL
jgi:hypothetical protein